MKFEMYNYTVSIVQCYVLSTAKRDFFPLELTVSGRSGMLMCLTTVKPKIANWFISKAISRSNVSLQIDDWSLLKFSIVFYRRHAKLEGEAAESRDDRGSTVLILAERRRLCLFSLGTFEKGKMEEQRKQSRRTLVKTGLSHSFPRRSNFDTDNSWQRRSLQLPLISNRISDKYWQRTLFSKCCWRSL